MWFKAPESMILEGLDAKIDPLKADACVPDWENELVGVVDVDGTKLAMKR